MTEPSVREKRHRQCRSAVKQALSGVTKDRDALKRRLMQQIYERLDPVVDAVTGMCDVTLLNALTTRMEQLMAKVEEPCKGCGKVHDDIPASTLLESFRQQRETLETEFPGLVAEAFVALLTAGVGDKPGLTPAFERIVYERFHRSLVSDLLNEQMLDALSHMKGEEA